MVVPHFVTALSGPITELEQRMLDAMPAIERWLRLEWMEHTPAFYCAVEVRNAGFKLAPVETDLHPQGWHHLTPEMQPLAVQAAMAAIEKICPEARNLLIVPENRRRDPAYLSNLAQLQRIFHLAGLNVRLGSISADLKHSTTIDLPTGESLTLEPVLRSNGRIGVKDFDPCTILLNNDLRAGVPGILEDLYQQYLLPPLHASWSIRRKSRHASCYEEVCKRFGKLIGIDPWLILPLFDHCAASTVAELAAHTEALLTKIRKKYKEYGIKGKPFVVLKRNDNRALSTPLVLYGTKELPALLAQQGIALDLEEWLLQEGVPSCEQVNTAPVVPLVYMLDRYVVGACYLAHAAGTAPDAIDTGTGAWLAWSHDMWLPQAGARPGGSMPNRFYMYGVIARLAMLAASYQLEATDPQAQDFN